MQGDRCLLMTRSGRSASAKEPRHSEASEANRSGRTDLLLQEMGCELLLLFLLKGVCKKPLKYTI